MRKEEKYCAQTWSQVETYIYVFVVWNINTMKVEGKKI